MRNDLQAAVEYFKSLLQTIADDEWNREARNSATAALSALRDMMRRREGCAMCRGIVRAEKIDMILAYKADGGIAGLSEISCNYCPRCGRKLEDEE